MLKPNNKTLFSGNSESKPVKKVLNSILYKSLFFMDVS
jgi:hypothetical protein